MTKLKYSLLWTSSGGPSPAGPQVTSSYIAGATGTPQTRIYPSGSPTSFVNYPLALTGMADGNLQVDYKDSSVALQALATLALNSYSTSCWKGGTYINPSWRFTRYETYIEIRGILSAGAGQTEVSIGGGGYKTLINDGSGYAASFTNSEIDALGYGGLIPNIHIRRTYETNLLSVSNFSNVSGPGPGPTFTRIDVSGSTAGYVPGDFVRFKNSTLYNSLSGYVVEVHPAYLILQMAYMGNQSGATAYERAICDDIIAANVFTGDIAVDAFTVTETHTNETAAEADDGTIILSLTLGSGSFSFAWDDGPTTQNRSGLQAGTYGVTITDDVTGQEETLEIVITEPAVVPPPNGTYLEIPKMQSLRFVREAVIDNCNTFQNFDNTLFCKMVFYGVKIKRAFYQKVCRCDAFAIQVHSNFSSHTVDLMSATTGLSVKSFNNIELKQQLTGIVSGFNGYITNSAGVDPAGTSRVYFNTATIPTPVSIGQAFSIINNADGFDGTYSIVGISNDVLLGSPYLLITLNYSAGTPTSSMRAIFTQNVLDFDIYETILSFQDVAEGYYFMRIRGVNPDTSFSELVSEPIHLRNTHPSTHLIEARNFDNTDDVVFTTGIVVRIRLESKLQKPLPGRQGENYRETNGNPVKLANKPQRKYKFDWFEQPFYRHELLNSLLGWDQILVNKVEYFCEEGPAEPANRDFYLLSNGNATLEQRNWFQQYNGDDLGGSVDPGYILTQYGYIQRT